MKKSAGLLLFRRSGDETEFFLVHPGGPFFTKKDEGWWTVPKGELKDGEDPLDAAMREFEEETGYRPAADFIPLQPVQQKGGKTVWCWAVEGELDAETIKSNTFEIEWPPRSGLMKTYPEIDKAGWFNYSRASLLINERQTAFLKELIAIIG